MKSDSKRKINILQKYGASRSFFQLESNTWKGIMYSCSRADFDLILTEPALKYYGVYILLSDSKVYVGQATNLCRRTKDHMVDKEWWDRIILLTDSDDKLSVSDIDYLENVMIERVSQLGDSCDNSKKGNPKKVDEYRKVDLDDYLDEAFDLLKFLGIDIFNGKYSFNDSASGSQKPKNNTINSKADAVRLAFGSEYPLNNCTYAKLQTEQGIFWANPHKDRLKEDWRIILNDQVRNELIILMVPADSFTLDKNSPRHLETRDNGKVDLKISRDTLIDSNSNSNFKQYVKNIVKY